VLLCVGLYSFNVIALGVGLVIAGGWVWYDSQRVTQSSSAIASAKKFDNNEREDWNKLILAKQRAGAIGPPVYSRPPTAPNTTDTTKPSRQ